MNTVRAIWVFVWTSGLVALAAACDSAASKASGDAGLSVADAASMTGGATGEGAGGGAADDGGTQEPVRDAGDGAAGRSDPGLGGSGAGGAAAGGASAAGGSSGGNKVSATIDGTPVDFSIISVSFMPIGQSYRFNVSASVTEPEFRSLSLLLAVPQGTTSATPTCGEISLAYQSESKGLVATTPQSTCAGNFSEIGAQGSGRLVGEFSGTISPPGGGQGVEVTEGQVDVVVPAN